MVTFTGTTQTPNDTIIELTNNQVTFTYGDISKATTNTLNLITDTPTTGHAGFKPSHMNGRTEVSRQDADSIHEIIEECFRDYLKTLKSVSAVFTIEDDMILAIVDKTDKSIDVKRGDIIKIIQMDGAPCNRVIKTLLAKDTKGATARELNGNSVAVECGNGSGRVMVLPDAKTANAVIDAVNSIN